MTTSSSPPIVPITMEYLRQHEQREEIIQQQQQQMQQQKYYHHDHQTQQQPQSLSLKQKGNHHVQWSPELSKVYNFTQQNSSNTSKDDDEDNSIMYHDHHDHFVSPPKDLTRPPFVHHDRQYQHQPQTDHPNKGLYPPQQQQQQESSSPTTHLMEDEEETKRLMDFYLAATTTTTTTTPMDSSNLCRENNLQQRRQQQQQQNYNNNNRTKNRWIAIGVIVIMVVFSSMCVAWLVSWIVYGSHRHGRPMHLSIMSKKKNHHHHPRLKVKPVLKFHRENNDDDSSEYKFKILQLTDLHLGESSTNDARTWELIDTLISKEQPDLIVLTGDQISANYCIRNGDSSSTTTTTTTTEDTNGGDGTKKRNKKNNNNSNQQEETHRICAMELYYQMGMKLSEYEIPWALTFGDTDNSHRSVKNANTFEYRNNPDGQSPSSHLQHTNNNQKTFVTRQDLLRIDQSFDYSMTDSFTSLFSSENNNYKYNPVFGTTNYYLTIFVEQTPAAQVYFFDTGGGSSSRSSSIGNPMDDSLPLQLDQSQISWFLQTNQRLPAVAFQHVPSKDFQYQSKVCMGYHHSTASTTTATTTSDSSSGSSSSTTGDTNSKDNSSNNNGIILGSRQQQQQQHHNDQETTSSSSTATNPFLDFDSGIANALSETARIYFLAAGHDHDNHYCCPYTRWLQLCTGARTGYGGDDDHDYNKYDNVDEYKTNRNNIGSSSSTSRMERGARVFELSIMAPKDYKLEWKSWVRMESGDVYGQVNRHDIMTEKG